MREAHAPIKRKCGRIILGHFEEHLGGTATGCFGRCFAHEKHCKARAARAGPRAERLNFRFSCGGLNDNEGLRIVLILTGHKRKGAGPLQQATERIRVPRIGKAGGMHPGKSLGIGEACKPNCGAQGAAAGSFASGARK